MTNAIKAYALLALLIGLTLFVGEQLGGRDGLMIALVLSFGMSFISYWFSDAIVLSMYGARRVHPDQYPTLYAIVRDLAARAGIPTPAIYIIPSSSPNAFATGRGPSHAAVAVTEGIVALLTPEELSGVLAHEIAHIANYDVLLSTIVAVLAGSLSYLSRMVMWGGLGRSRSDDERGNPLLGLLMVILAPFVALLIQMAISRSREYLADETGARFCGHPEWLASALYKLQQAIAVRPMMGAEPATSHLFIANPFSGGALVTLFSTHPPMADRINRLLAMANGR
ncbi:MAG: Peptidase M48, Ste24p precursor [Candidatus Ozemobacter sibiricus]|jgi:heat shock protein HtpX|uniref:Protease HtpX homolog n=1 Tax=Candidatus Ozemobacter sibiricus TaxID=2268124 RepID=A0A367ZQJ2_9BACT|nr:MAG: Peptidase M48, Ste24p precursor [Candidatus Ozemobacter sibiricus]